MRSGGAADGARPPETKRPPARDVHHLAVAACAVIVGARSFVGIAERAAEAMPAELAEPADCDC